ncbi:MAG: OmpA family protein [Minwuia sp.]|uniref:OmpA family protein n=1 Tax=Minwuia sp. TaxID=2493630 RepID=UPI003A87B177
MVAALPAQAELWGPYVSGGVLGSFAPDQTLRNSALSPMDFKAGYGGSAAVGYQFPSGIRLEGEAAYRHNGLNEIGGVNASGYLGAGSLMANVLFELDNDMGIYPYFGGGIGGAILNINDGNANNVVVLDDRDVVLAYQGLAGIAFALSPNLSLIGEYRYFRTSEADFSNAAGATVTTDFTSHTAMLGLRYRFGAGPMAARQSTEGSAALAAVERTRPPRRIAETVPKPAPLPVAQARAAASLRRTYVVYFPLDVATLTPEARQTVAEASERAKTDGTAVIELAGHADRSGPEAYNLDLSRKRAENTAAEIRRNGVQSKIQVKAFGETQPEVPTADGAYEPRNRRVEVVLQGKGDGLTN